MTNKVRLTDEQINGIISSIAGFVKNQDAKLYLYGSRTNLAAKGGDIDLLLIVGNNEQREALQGQKHYILAEIKKNIGDQKIDLLIAPVQELFSDEFLQVIFPSALLLHDFNFQ